MTPVSPSNRVLFPQPEGPTSTWNLPLGTVRPNPEKTFWLLKYFVTSDTWSIKNQPPNKKNKYHSANLKKADVNPS
jgi:hypothetical protein